jgi:SAM-dependent methyltransferase
MPWKWMSALTKASAHYALRVTVDRLFPRRIAERPRRLQPSGRAFGVDPARKEYYSVRQARYDALADDISGWAGAALDRDRLRLLIVGCGVGTELRHLEAKPHFEKLAVSGANLVGVWIYRQEVYEEFFVGDLTQGYPEIRSDFYDIVVCEQVLEHLTKIDTAIAALERVLKPGGKAIIGVPIFPPPLHLVRSHIVPRIDVLFARRRSRGHLQAFSLSSFRAALGAYSHLKLLKVRGFRVISGGLLRPLDNYRWWWRMNRRLGELVPALCIEVQAILEKPLIRP